MRDSANCRNSSGYKEKARSSLLLVRIAHDNSRFKKRVSNLSRMFVHPRRGEESSDVQLGMRRAKEQERERERERRNAPTPSSAVERSQRSPPSKPVQISFAASDNRKM